MYNPPFLNHLTAICPLLGSTNLSSIIALPFAHNWVQPTFLQPLPNHFYKWWGSPPFPNHSPTISTNVGQPTFPQPFPNHFFKWWGSPPFPNRFPTISSNGGAAHLSPTIVFFTKTHQFGGTFSKIVNYFIRIAFSRSIDLAHHIPTFPHWPNIGPTVYFTTGTFSEIPDACDCRL